jgi:glycosyltransferase involved in cell wall biosynthesis
MHAWTAGERGRLDGLTILRFAHAYECGGGVERHLDDLNRELGRRNRITTVQIQLTSDGNRLGEIEQKVGSSTLLTVPLLAQGVSKRTESEGQAAGVAFLNRFLRVGLNLLLCTPKLNDVAMRRLFKWRTVPRRVGEPETAGAKAAEIMRRFAVDLVVLHTSGGADTSEIIEVARAAGVPLAIVHHFSNNRLGGISVRQQVCRVDGVAGASSVDVPRYLRTCFWNLSDAVDTEFYSREKARPRQDAASAPVLYAPGRLIPEKGQADVIEVASLLKERGLNTTVVFAGREEVPEFGAHLQRIAAQRGLSDSVRFLGPLSLEDYRDWYCAAQAILMPTRHSEGMPRTLLESQAMKVPPVVYDVGGTSEGIRDKETGFLIKMGDVEGMAAAVETLIRNPALQRSMAEAGRRFVEEAFSLPAFAKRHEDFYAHVLANAGSPRSTSIA